MYEFREKNRHHRELLDPSHAKADYELLKSSDPTSTVIAQAAACQPRYAGEILFALLNVKTREEIVANRRTMAKANNNLEDPDAAAKKAAADAAKKAAAAARKAAARKEKSAEKKADASKSDKPKAEKPKAAEAKAPAVKDKKPVEVEKKS